ncbi:MBL fold metallo-hydrolase [Parvularcula maris]|uniref:MBL fold metallo-hydrolase n=1 Tax=Parvularcula maris TaxID=2965077 RepID=A0A9X2LBV7_9PROT|nr:MBL fold metallo-hydrolase [Parvularcula maris]MCQ8185707.1 MBL fold metallo-hydrolase [Parvularcula maris]
MPQASLFRPDRRLFLVGSAAGLAAAGSASAHTAAQLGKTVATESFARLEELAPGVYAVVSTPIGKDGSFQTQTVCNGGLIVGEEKIVAVDAFLQPAGAAWLQGEAKRLTGRDITDVVLTHFHPDHSGGVAGYFRGGEGPNIYATETTRRIIIDRLSAPREVEDSAFLQTGIIPVLPTRIIPDDAGTASLDLGGRSVTLDLKRGHTPSDVAIHVDDEPVTFAGDLVWKDFFHNYVDAIPTELRRSVGELLEDRSRMIVTGHGSLGKADSFGDYTGLLDHVEEQAKKAHKKGMEVSAAAKEFSVPKKLGEWRLFSPSYYETAFQAWYRELG